MDDWRIEFQYLLDRKILARDELAYLFGQIKSIVDREVKQLQAENKQWKELSGWQDNLLACYRMGTNPSEKCLDRIYKLKQALQGK